MVKISFKELNAHIRFGPASFRVDVQDATTELPADSENIHVTLPQKATTTVCLAFCLHPYSMLSHDPLPFLLQNLPPLLLKDPLLFMTSIIE